MAEQQQTGDVQPAQRPDGAMAPVYSRLARLRSGARALLLVHQLALILAAVLAIGLGAGVIDFVVRWPQELRIFLWVVTLAAILGFSARAVWAAWRFRPNLTEMALRIERSHPALSGWLASAIDLSRAEPDRSGVARGVAERAADLLDRVRVSTVLRRERAGRSLGALALATAALLGLAVLTPALVSIGARRVATPWAEAEWPKRTGVADATGLAVHPFGAALPLRAGLLKSDRSAEQTRVTGVYRLYDGERALGAERRVLLTSQNRPVDASKLEGGVLFERLIEPTSLVADAGGSSASAAQATRTLRLRYWFETADDRTEAATILLAEPPRVIGAVLNVRAPAYAKALGESAGDQRIDLGPGTDARARVGGGSAGGASVGAGSGRGVLAGSLAELRISFNKPVIVPERQALEGGEGLGAWISGALGADLAEAFDRAGAQAPEIRFGGSGQEWVVSWRMDEPAEIAVRAQDEHGIWMSDEARYSLGVVRDNPPTVVVDVPGEDRAVLATAIVELGAEARDDVALSWLVLESQHARRPAGSAGAPPEPNGEPAELAKAIAVESAEGSEGLVDARTLTTRRTLDLGTLELVPGDELWVSALAADAFVLDERRHEPVRSSVRKLRIISRQELVEQVWAELGGVRRNAIALDAEQEKAEASLERAGAKAAEESQRAQAGITERLKRQRESVERLERHLRDNQLEDQSLQDVLDAARSALENAQRDSAEASQKAGEAARSEDAAAKAGEGSDEQREAQEEAQRSREEAGESQEDVRESLADLIEALDQGQDTWATRRSLERMIQEQKELLERTKEQGKQTAGKAAEQLSPAQRESLERLAAEQQAAADRTKDAVEKMQEKQEQMKGSDPASAQAMQDAAKRAERENVSQKQEEASRQLQENQTNSAQQQQQSAIESMEEMLEDLDRAQQNKDEVLRRFLATLMDSIRALIADQEMQIGSLNAADEGGDAAGFEGLDAAMALLNQNTLSVSDEAAGEGGGREGAAIARVLERASSPQQRAVTFLRDRPVNVDETLDAENESLERLSEALELAQKIDEQAADREEARVRNELRKKYGETLGRQVTIRDATEPLVGAEANRRNRNSARLLGQDQTLLREDLAKMLEETTELRDAKVFEFAHKRLGELMEAAAASLAQGDASAEVMRRQQSSIQILKSMVDSLGNTRRNEKPFREQESQQQAGGGGGGQQNQKGLPPTAELKLLRDLQQEAMDFTRAVSEAPQANPEAVAEAATLQSELAEQGRELMRRVSQGGAPAGIEPGGAGDRGIAPEEPEVQP